MQAKSKFFDDIKIGDQYYDKQHRVKMLVTELTEKGFKYTCEEYHLLPARFGPSLVCSGEVWYKLHPEIYFENIYDKVKS